MIGFKLHVYNEKKCSGNHNETGEKKRMITIYLLKVWRNRIFSFHFGILGLIFIYTNAVTNSYRLLGQNSLPVKFTHTFLLGKRQKLVIYTSNNRNNSGCKRRRSDKHLSVLETNNYSFIKTDKPSWFTYCICHKWKVTRTDSYILLVCPIFFLLCLHQALKQQGSS